MKSFALPAPVARSGAQDQTSASQTVTSDRRSRYWLLLLSICVIPFLYGFAHAASGIPNLTVPPLGGITTTNTAPSPSSLVSYVPDDKNKLRVGDKVSFQIIEDREAAKVLTVADSGELDCPYIGRVAAADKTCKQLAEELKVQLEKEYYYRATVILALEQANRFLGRVYVWGQVKTQGPLEMAVNEKLTAGKAILRAGGFGDFANKKRVKVIRAATSSGEKQMLELNMVEILEEGKTEKDVVLNPDDSVIISKSLINF